MTAPTIAFKGVTHRYRGSTAADPARLDNVDNAALDNPALDVPEQIVGPGPTAILGPNGSGKTTLLRLVATVAEAQTGSIRIDGLDPRDPSQRTAIRRRLGYQTQTGALPPRMRVDAFCDYVGALKEIASAPSPALDPLGARTNRALRRRP